MNKGPAYYWQQSSLFLHVYLKPNAPKDDYVGIYNNCLKLKIKAPPVDGKANRELLRFLGEIFAVPQSSIHLMQGEASRYKKIEILNPAALPDWIAGPGNAYCKPDGA